MTEKQIARVFAQPALYALIEPNPAVSTFNGPALDANNVRAAFVNDFLTEAFSDNCNLVFKSFQVSAMLNNITNSTGLSLKLSDGNDGSQLALSLLLS